MNNTLLQQVKDKLNITWSDADTERRVTNIILNAEKTLINKLAITNDNYDFSVVGEENNIFLAYCLYEFNHESNNFDFNYSNDISQIRRKHILNTYLESLEGE